MQKNSCLFIASLVEDILDLSRIEFNSFELNNSQFNPKEVVDEVYEMVEFTAK